MSSFNILLIRKHAPPHRDRGSCLILLHIYKFSGVNCMQCSCAGCAARGDWRVKSSRVELSRVESSWVYEYCLLDTSIYICVKFNGWVMGRLIIVIKFQYWIYLFGSSSGKRGLLEVMSNPRSLAADASGLLYVLLAQAPKGILQLGPINLQAP